MSLIVIIFISFINKMYFDNKNIKKIDPRLRAKLKIHVSSKSLSEVDMLKEQVKNMEIQLEHANIDKNNLEKLKVEPKVSEKSNLVCDSTVFR